MATWPSIETTVNPYKWVVFIVVDSPKQTVLKTLKFPRSLLFKQDLNQEYFRYCVVTLQPSCKATFCYNQLMWTTTTTKNIEVLTMKTTITIHLKQ